MAAGLQSFSMYVRSHGLREPRAARARVPDLQLNTLPALSGPLDACKCPLGFPSPCLGLASHCY